MASLFLKRTCCARDARPSRSIELIVVVLNDCVGEELLAHALDFLAGTCWIALGDLDFDEFALPNAFDPAEA